ncbi:MAG: arylamine N-acetyltransferase [Fibrobacterales bacterium]
MKSLNTYLNSLDVTQQEPSLGLVAELQKKHLSHFCFNNVAVLLDWPLSIQIEGIVEKIVQKNLGGYCFEHNKLFHDVLDSLGFDVRCLIAKVVNNQSIDPPRTHRITLLTFESEQYIVDVGFGPNCIQEPIKIEHGFVSHQENKTYRITVNANNDFQLELLKESGPFVLYTFDLYRYTEADCAMGNFYSCTHPNAIFVNNLVIARILPDVTLSLRNDQYHKIGKEHTEAIHIQSAPQLKAIIEDDFHIVLTQSEAQTLFKVTKEIAP